MNINYDILKNFLNHNKSIKLEFDDSTNNLHILINKDIVLSLKLNNDDIASNSDLIYNSIINLDNVNMYIPKIYIK